MSDKPPVGDKSFADARDRLLRLEAALGAAIVGQPELISGLVTAVFAGGHVLVEGLPGLGKTHLAKGLAHCLGLQLQRIQCTPDLMPADVTGTEVLRENGVQGKHFEFMPGPIFGNLLLVDEINRASPKTQSAMLEAMQEQQVTVLGQQHALPTPFWMIATQNPIELEGTYPLPEAQLDRFIFKLRAEMPMPDALLNMLDVSLDTEPSQSLTAVLSLAQVAQVMAVAREVMVAQHLKLAAVELVSWTHNSESTHFRYGASPRALQAMIRAGRVKALLAGRTHLTRSDLAAVALPALRHRVLLNIDSELRGIDIDGLLREKLAQWQDQH
jgi:MoxR-like ATPase